MSKKWFLAVCLVVSFILPTTIFASVPSIKVLVNGKEIQSDVVPVLDKSSGRVLVPMRAIFEALGYKVEWDTVIETGIAKLETPTDTITASVQPDSQTLKVRYQNWLKAEDKASGSDKCYTDFYFMLPLDKNNPVRTINGRLMLPTRIISEALGSKVTWNGATQVVTIDTTGAKIVAPKGWEKAISDNYKAFSPEHYYMAGYDYEGAYNYDFTFNGAKRESLPSTTSDNLSNTENLLSEKEIKPVPIATITPVIITGYDGRKQDITPVDTANGTIYKVYDFEWNKVFEYNYTNPKVATVPPMVGSFPAKILIDESKKATSYLKSPSLDKNDYNNWVVNLTPKYGVSGLSLGGCNWYAEARFWEVTGIPIPHFRESDDKLFWKTENYLDAADKYDELLALRDKNDIQPNSIALFTSPTANHVLFVEYVERDSNGKPVNVYVTEANVNGNGKYRYGVDGEVTKYSFEGLKSRSNKQYQGCIVVNQEFYE